jgi:GAF domain-containing protein
MAQQYPKNSRNRSYLYAPIIDKNNQHLGILEFAIDSSERNFTERGVLIAKITARHIGIILEKDS